MHSRHPVIAPLRCLLEFAQAVEIKRLLTAVAQDPPQTFWRYTTGVMTDIAAIEWCKVFGAYGEDTHWTHVIPKEKCDETRKGLLAAVKMNEEGWTKYHASVLNYRNQMGAHHDLGANIEKYPHFDSALQAAYFIYGRLYAILKDGESGGIPEPLERWSKTVAGNMAPIIRHAFAGSAKLGSNMMKQT